MRPRALAPPSIALVLLLGSVASAAPTHERADEECASVAPGTHAVRVAWGAPRATSGCFFFSGPGELGRDDQLGPSARLIWRQQDVALTFGQLRFVGRAHGGVIRLVRRSRHEYGGAWTVTETIELREERGRCTVLRGHYRYTECQGGGPCPGQCTIDAPLTISIAR